MERVIFKTDAKCVVDALQTRSVDLIKFDSIVARCNLFLLKEETLEVCFVRRQTNIVADALANVTCS